MSAGCAELIVVGVSFGGAVAQQMAHVYPRLQKILVLVSTSIGCGSTLGSLEAIWSLMMNGVLWLRSLNTARAVVLWLQPGFREGGVGWSQPTPPSRVVPLANLC
jgi:pimeloyl-ACP methyl ester carboxylesterase